ncbi:MAG: carbohydrate ABC transporter permease [Lachnospiraceae bacterium]|nr:carbohydrate ABC transporter permease [Lachnospiraceae bacterium]
MNTKKLKKIKTFDVVNALVMIVICFCMVYPVWYVIVNSLSEGTEVLKGGIYWWPRKFCIKNYTAVFESSEIFTAFGITILKTVIGTVTSVFFTAMVAYGLSKTYLVGRKIFMMLGVITMFFSGGLIPYFLVIKSLGMLDSFWVYIIPSLFSFYNAIIFMTFFRNIPAELEESAKIDGTNDFVIFLRIILPVSTPVIATIALFNGVGQWNDYFTGVIYITNKQYLVPIQTFLYKVISESSSTRITANMPASVRSSMVTSTTVKYATMVVTTFPIVCVYPFLQKYFVQGIMVGSVKG